MASAKSAAPAAPAPAGPPHPADFSDRISPMLVKELRQGMKTHLFTLAFILLQAFMVLSVLIGASSPGDSGAVSGFFWFFVWVALVLVMPIRGFSALTAEIQANTLDLIHLTGLGAWRITLGKWAALVAQTLLLVCGILPYLVMRYFFGEVDLLRDLVSLFWLLLLSLVLTAATVGFSAFRSVLIRAGAILVFAAGLPAAGKAALPLLELLLDPAGGATPRSTIAWSVAATVATAAYLAWFLLDLGASRIAPEADNHATRKRLAALGFGGGVLLLPLAGLDPAICLLIAGAVWSLVCLDALTERPVLLPGLLVPFSRRWYLRPWTFFLTPGWHTGIFFLLLCAAIFTGAIHGHLGLANLGDVPLQTLAAIPAALLFPLLPMHLFFRRLSEPATRFGLYLLIQCGCGILSFFLMILAKESPLGEVAYLLLPLPMTALFASSAGAAPPLLGVSSLVFAAAAVIVTTWQGRHLYRDAARILLALRAARP